MGRRQERVGGRRRVVLRAGAVRRRARGEEQREMAQRQACTARGRRLCRVVGVATCGARRVRRQPAAEGREVVDRVRYTLHRLARAHEQQRRGRAEAHAHAAHVCAVARRVEHRAHTQRAPDRIRAQHKHALGPCGVLCPAQRRRALRRVAEHHDGVHVHRGVVRRRQAREVHERVDRLEQLRAQLGRVPLKHKLHVVLAGAGAARHVLHHTQRHAAYKRERGQRPRRDAAGRLAHEHLRGPRIVHAVVDVKRDHRRGVRRVQRAEEPRRAAHAQRRVLRHAARRARLGPRRVVGRDVRLAERRRARRRLVRRVLVRAYTRLGAAVRKDLRRVRRMVLRFEQRFGVGRRRFVRRAPVGHRHARRRLGHGAHAACVVVRCARRGARLRRAGVRLGRMLPRRSVGAQRRRRRAGRGRRACRTVVRDVHRVHVHGAVREADEHEHVARAARRGVGRKVRRRARRGGRRVCVERAPPLVVVVRWHIALHRRRTYLVPRRRAARARAQRHAERHLQRRGAHRGRGDD